MPPKKKRGRKAAASKDMGVEEQAVALPFKKPAFAHPSKPNNMRSWKGLKQLLQKDVTTPYERIRGGRDRKPAKTYCDITGYATSYKCPKTELRFFSVREYDMVTALPEPEVIKYKEIRNAVKRI